MRSASPTAFGRRAVGRRGERDAALPPFRARRWPEPRRRGRFATWNRAGRRATRRIRHVVLEHRVRAVSLILMCSGWSADEQPFGVSLVVGTPYAPDEAPRRARVLQLLSSPATLHGRRARRRNATPDTRTRRRSCSTAGTHCARRCRRWPACRSHRSACRRSCADICACSALRSPGPCAARHGRRARRRVVADAELVRLADLPCRASTGRRSRGGQPAELGVALGAAAV